LAGRVPVMFADPASALPQVKAGNVRALGVSSMTRMTAAAEIPSIAEAGFSGFEAVVWIMVVAPAHTSIEIVSKLHATFKAILARPDVRRRIIELGAIPVDSPPRGDLRKFIKSETVRWGRIVKKAGLSGSR
jgi:tripartite-type tricarboxylate transporter receptor subunit TctC